MRGPNQLGRLVFYREREECLHLTGVMPTTPLKVAGVVEHQPWNRCYLVRDLPRKPSPSASRRSRS
jgi:hypothetical protein